VAQEEIDFAPREEQYPPVRAEDLATSGTDFASPFEDELDTPAFLRRRDEDEDDRDTPAFLRRAQD
jgi:hypothetical protein